MPRLRRRTRKGGLRIPANAETLRNLKAVLSYERNAGTRNTFLNGNTLTVRNRIQRLLAAQAPLDAEWIVWRGQASNTIIPTSWMSTSAHPHIALMYGGTHLFKIHLEPGIQCLDMYAYYAQHNLANPAKETAAIRNLLGQPNLNMSHNYALFGEILVVAGGTFWANASHTKAGFKVVGKTRSGVVRANMPPPSANGQAPVFTEADYPIIPVLETWYSMDCAGRRCDIA